MPISVVYYLKLETREAIGVCRLKLETREATGVCRLKLNNE